MAEIDVTRIRGNIGAMNALNSLKEINKQLAIHQTRLASGKQINSASDDPAGLSIATRMLSRSDGLKVALNNIGDAKNLLAVAESGMSNINDILVQMRDKAETGASDTMGDSERAAINTQLQAYAAQINDIADQTKWNDTQLIGSSSASSLRLQTGVDVNDFTTLDNLGDMHATGSLLNIGTMANVATQNGSTTDANISVKGGDAFTGLSALSSGTYNVQYSYDKTNGKLNVSLLAADGTTAQAVDADGTNGTTNTTATSLSLDWDGSADKTVDFGNGVQVTFDKSKFTDDVASTKTSFSFTKDSVDLGLGAGKAADYAAYMDTIQKAIDVVNTHLSSVGAITGRLDFKETQVSADQTNIEAAYNRIMNADMADEQVQSSKYQILQQTATAMLAQANTSPQFLLSLFK
jgi:flagellin